MKRICLFVIALFYMALAYAPTADKVSAVPPEDPIEIEVDSCTLTALDVKKSITERIANSSKGDSLEQVSTISKLPALLRIIDEEAFEGTALQIVSLPNSAVIVGNRAFANIKNLKLVWIPETNVQIAKTAFIGSNRVILTGGNVARKAAKENGVPFVPTATVIASANRPDNSVNPGNGRTDAKSVCKNASDGAEGQPHWSVAVEIKAGLNDSSMANPSLGRSPPDVEVRKFQESLL